MKKNNNIKNVKPAMVAISMISSLCKAYTIGYCYGMLVKKVIERKEDKKLADLLITK